MDKHPKGVAEIVQQWWDQAAGAVSNAEEEVARLFARLPGMAALQPDEARRHVRELAERLMQQRKDSERRLEEAVRVAVGRLKVPTRDDVQLLSARLESLSKRIEELDK